jgi:hypothetical protein
MTISLTKEQTAQMRSLGWLQRKTPDCRGGGPGKSGAAFSAEVDALGGRIPAPSTIIFAGAPGARHRI